MASLAGTPFAGAAAAALEVPSPSVKLAYGTAGFRTVAQHLDAVVLRMGMLAALRATQLGQAVGVMVTASHNPIQDNGVKMVDPDGGMLARAWEKYACDLADATPDAVPAVLSRIADAEKIDLHAAAAAGVKARVVVGRDTRPSSAHLSALCVAGAEACGAAVEDAGLATTPLLHHCVKLGNAASPQLRAAYGGAGGYVRMLREGFDGVLSGVDPAAAARGPVVIDCAHGVGAASAEKLAAAFAGAMDMRLRNTGATAAEAQLLNEGVGAEHAQKERLPPAGFTAAADAGVRCASLDGDADRLVYHYFRPSAVPGEAAQWRLLDGDKIACLAAAFLADLLRASGLAITGEPAHSHDHHDPCAQPASAGMAPDAALAALRAAPVSVGIVQTAYANGASGAYVRSQLKLPVLLAKTGVKFVHAAAAAFDIGVYFEANGHGTVLFHPEFAAKLQAAVEGLKPQQLAAALPGGAEAARALTRLHWCTRLINQAVGDALSDALFVEAVLAVKGWDVAQWDAIYEDLPSRQAKLPVPDRSAVVTTADESRVVAPAALQDAIDALVAAVPCGRAFVRPSGTEDVVRVYAEGDTQAAADKLAADVAAAVQRILGGSGSGAAAAH